MGLFEIDTDLLIKLGVKAGTIDEKSARNAEDIQLWKEWQESGMSQKKMKPLHERFKGMINHRAKGYVGVVSVPPAAIRAEFAQKFTSALKTYNPDKGATLGTWVDNQLRSAGRFIRTYQNTGKIPEARVLNVSKFNQAKGILQDSLGREPTVDELSDHLKWPMAEVDRMASEMRKDLHFSAYVENPLTKIPSRERKIIRQVQYELTPEEKGVWEHMFGMNGKTATNDMSAIAKSLKLSPTKAYRLRHTIGQKIQEHL